MKSRAVSIGLVALAGLAALLVAAGAQAQAVDAAVAPLRITSITPSGSNVPPGRQIVIQFDRPVVPIGRMERCGRCRGQG
jgi:hypothetical protein